MLVLSPRSRTVAYRTFRIVSLLLFWYLSSFFLMMSWLLPAYDPESHQEVGQSSYFMAPAVRMDGDFTIYCTSASSANWFFYPLDKLIHGAKHMVGYQFYSRSQAAMAIRDVLFWANLLLPSFSYAVGHAQPLKRKIVQVSLAIGVAGWYLVLMVLCHLARMSPFWSKSLATIGTILGLGALYWLARTGNWIFLVPLAFATAFGTIWMLFALPI